jgi:hypothetical protein
LLHALEKAAIVRGEEYRDDRRYELGHDWLAQRLRELRTEREEAEEEHAAKRRLEKAKAARRQAIAIATVAIVVALLMGGLAWWAKQQSELARTRSIMAGVREHLAKHENHWAAQLLLEIKDPEHTRDWTNLAGQVLYQGMRYRTFAVNPGDEIKIAEWSPDGMRVLVVTNKQIRVERVFGNEERWEVKPGTEIGRVTSAAWSPGGNRLAIVDEHGALFVWALEGRTVRLHEGNGSKTA